MLPFSFSSMASSWAITRLVRDDNVVEAKASAAAFLIISRREFLSGIVCEQFSGGNYKFSITIYELYTAQGQE